MTTQAPTDPVRELMLSYRAISDDLADHEAKVKNLKASLTGIEAQLRDHMIRNGLQGVTVRGLYSCSLATTKRYTDMGGFIPWALENDPSCLTVSLKQSGVAAFADANGVLPPGVASTPVTKATLRRSK